MKNDWELAPDTANLKTEGKYDLSALYSEAHEELSLQQNKRDGIITVFLGICSFLIPLTFGNVEDSITRGIIFLALGAIGILFSLICIRYKVYKDIYWLCCKTITLLMNQRDENITKSTVQRTFNLCLSMSGRKYLRDGKLSKRRFFRKNLSSAEAIYFSIISLITSFVFGLGFFFIFEGWLGILLTAIASVIPFSWLYLRYLGKSFEIYLSLDGTDESEEAKNRRNKYFTSVFDKAWFLHIYY